MIEIFTKELRKYLVKDGDFTLRRYFNIDFEDAESIENLGIYIHIPFCKNSCPYCPYNKIKYDEKLVKPFVDAIIKEIVMYGEKLEGKEINSIYIGGGTPTNIINEMNIILKEIRKWFKIKGDICIETNPIDISKENLTKLKEFGIITDLIPEKNSSKGLIDLFIKNKIKEKNIFLPRSSRANNYLPESLKALIKKME